MIDIKKLYWDTMMSHLPFDDSTDQKIGRLMGNIMLKELDDNPKSYQGELEYLEKQYKIYSKCKYLTLLTYNEYDNGIKWIRENKIRHKALDTFVVWFENNIIQIPPYAHVALFIRKETDALLFTLTFGAQIKHINWPYNELKLRDHL